MASDDTNDPIVDPDGETIDTTAETRQLARPDEDADVDPEADEETIDHDSVDEDVDPSSETATVARSSASSARSGKGAADVAQTAGSGEADDHDATAEVATSAVLHAADVNDDDGTESLEDDDAEERDPFVSSASALASPAPLSSLPERGFAARLAAFHRVKDPRVLAWEYRGFSPYRILEAMGMKSDGFAFAFAMSIAAAMILPFLGSMGFFDPWETHYGEVARQMAQRDDYLYPFWKDGYFFSKPVLLFWLTAPAYKLLGAGEAVGELSGLVELFGRLPIATIGLFTISCVWFACRRLFSTRAATLAAIVLSTTPFFIFISRQAITDMLYVGPMSSAICLLAVAFFDDETRDRWKNGKIPWLILAFFAFCLLPQMWEIGRTGAFLNRVTWLGSEFSTRLAASITLCLLALTGLALLRRWCGDPLIHLAAALVALATLGKGPHALVFTGMPYFLYFVISGEWKLLKRPAMLTGIGLYLAICMPWFIVMTLFEGKDGGKKVWFQRFILYDLLGRLGGVHGERGTHDYYVRYFAFGTLPWAPFAPVALFTAAIKRLRSAAERTPADRMTLLTVLWAIGLFAFFSITETKFHHYIFPVVVPSAILIGKFFDDLLDSPHRLPVGIALFCFFVVVVVGRDLVREPWQLVDLFSYHYVSYKPSYYFPADYWWRISIGVMSGLAAILVLVGALSDWSAEDVARRGENITLRPTLIDHDGAALSWWRQHWATKRRLGSLLALYLLLQFFWVFILAGIGQKIGKILWPPLRLSLAQVSQVGRGALAGTGRTVNGGFVLCALVGAFAYCLFTTHVYQPHASQHWTHRHLMHTYWTMKQPEDRLVSYQMDWKGETFYSHNTEQQIKKSASQLKKAVEAPGRTFVLVQQDRFKRIESAVGATYKDQIRVIDRSNKKWFLVLITDPPPAAK